MNATALRTLALAALLSGVPAFPSAAAPVTIDAIDSGFYNASGLHVVGNQNHLTGIFSGVEDRSFFLFDL
jgi:hypothetical protein